MPESILREVNNSVTGASERTEGNIDESLDFTIELIMPTFWVSLVAGVALFYSSKVSYSRLSSMFSVNSFSLLLVTIKGTGT